MKTIKDKKNSSVKIVMPERAIREEATAIMQTVRALAEDGFRLFIFDFGKTSMIDSAALGALIHMRKEHIGEGFAFQIEGASGYVKTVLDNAKISVLFAVKSEGGL